MTKLCEFCAEEAEELMDVDALREDKVQDLAAAIRRGDRAEAEHQLDALFSEYPKFQQAIFNGRISGMASAPILDRLDAALEKVRARQLVVRAIYLKPDDLAEFRRATTRTHRCPQPQWAGHEIREGRTSIVYSIHGVGVSVPARISRRCQ